MNTYDQKTMDEKATAYLDLAKHMLDEAFGEERAAWLARIEAELPQIRIVFDWLATQKDAQRGLQLAYLLQELWFEEVYTEEGFALLQRFLQLQTSGESAKLRAMCLDLAGALAINLGEYATALTLKEAGVSLLQPLGKTTQLAYALLHLGHLYGYAQEDYATAEAFYLEALGLFRHLQNVEGMTHATANLANAALESGNLLSARALTYESLRHYQEMDMAWELALLLNTTAGIEAASGYGETAVFLAAASAAHRQRIGVSMPEVYEKRYQQIEATVRASVAETEHPHLWQEGQMLRLDEAVNLAFERIIGE